MVAQRVQQLREARNALTDNRGLIEIADGLLLRQCEATGAQAGVVALLQDDSLEVVAYSNYDPDFIEPWQRFPVQVRTPLTDAVVSRTSVVVPSVDDLRQQYPGISPADDEPHAIAAFPLMTDGGVLGAVGLRFDVGRPDDDVVRAGEVLSGVAAEALAQRRSVDTLTFQVAQLQAALDSRIVIEQAKGVLAERHGISVGEAFELLRRHARSHATPLHDLAGRVVDGSESL